MTLPSQQPVLRLNPRHPDSNLGGDIFGGWLMSQIDIAGAIVASERARGQVSTVAVKYLNFIKPIFIKDLVSIYAEIYKVGNSSITVNMEVYAQRLLADEMQTVKVSEAQLVYVAIEKPGKKRSIPAL